MTIETHHKHIKEAIAGDIVGAFLAYIKCTDAKFSNLAFEKGAANFNKSADNLRVKILMINKKITLRIGSVFTLFCSNLNVPIKIQK